MEDTRRQETKSQMSWQASGLLAPSAGQLLVDGTDLAGRRPHVLTKAGVCHVPN